MNELVSQFAGPVIEAFKALLYLVVLVAAAILTNYLRRRFNVTLSAEQQARFEALAEKAIMATEQEWSKKALTGTTTPVGVLSQPAIHAERRQENSVFVDFKRGKKRPACRLMHREAEIVRGQRPDGEPEPALKLHRAFTDSPFYRMLSYRLSPRKENSEAAS